MSTEYQFFHLFFLIAASLAIVSAHQYLQYRTSIGRWGSAFLLVLGIELTSYSMFKIAAPFVGSLFWYSLQILSFYLLSVLWFFFVNSFSDQPPALNPQILFALLCVPLLILSLLLIPKGSVQIDVGEIVDSPNAIFGITFIGQWALIFVFYLSIIVLLSLLRLLQLFIRQRTWEDGKLFPPMLLGMFSLVTLGGIELMGINPLNPVSVLQIGLAFFSFVFFFYTKIYKFGGILPVGRASAFAVMRDGSILLDSQSRVIDLNPQAEKFLNCPKKDWGNKQLEIVWPEVARIIAAHPTENLLVKEITSPDTLGAPLTQISITRFVGINNTTTGRLVSIRNITERDQLEKELVERNQLMARSNTLMQELAELNLKIQATNDLSVVFEAVETHFARLDLDYFIVLVDPETNKLKLDHLSLKSDLVKRFENISKLELTGMPLSRSTFPELYFYLECKDGDYFTTTFRGKSAEVNFHSQLIDAGLKVIGIDPAMPIIVFHLSVGDHIIGLMGIWGSGLQLNNLNPLRVFSSQVAWAIERVNLSAQDKQQASELARSNQLLTALANVSAQMGRSSESSAALEVMGKELEAIGLHCILGTLELAGKEIVFQYASFESKIQDLQKYVPNFHLTGYKLPRKLWPGTKVVTEGVPIWYRDILVIFGKMFPMVPDNIFKLAIKQAGIAREDQLCILPLIVNGQINGVFPIWGKNIHESDTPALMVFAYQVAEFLHKTQGYEQESARAKNLARANNIIIALSNVAASLETTLNLKDVYETLGREMQKVQLQCMIGILDDAKQFLKIEYLTINPRIIEWSEKLGFSWSEELRIPRHLWPTDKAVTERAPYWDPDPIGSTCRMFPFLPRVIFEKTYEMAGMSTRDQVCYLPMVIEEDVIGIMGVWGPNLKDDDIPALSVFSNQVATAIKNTKLYNQAQEEISIRRQVEAKIQAALHEKEVLLKEIHHRVKNNLQVISSLLNLQIMQSKDASLVEGLRESQNRVRAMALIHEKLYQSADLARVNFASYLTSLTNNLSQTYQVSHDRISIRVEVSDILLDLDTAIPCGLIVNELVSNAIKYAFPDGKIGNISVACHQIKNGAFALSVADDGVGLPENINLAQASSLGLKLVSSLVRQIDGQMAVNRKGGVRYEIIFSQQKA